MPGRDDIVSCQETGKCALHEGFEIERRGKNREVDRELEELKLSYKEFKQWVYDKFESVSAKLEVASNFRSRAQIVGVIALVIFGSSFAYIQLHITRSDRRYELRKIEVQNRFDLQKAAMVKKYDIISAELRNEADKFHRLLNKTDDEVGAIKIELRLTTDRYQRIISDISRVESMLIEMMKTREDDHGNKIQPSHQ